MGTRGSRGHPALNRAIHTTSAAPPMIIANFAIPKDELPLLAGYLRLRNLLSVFNPTIDERRWRRLPSDISEATTGWIPVANEDDYLRRAARDMGDVEDRWPM